jgi:hypothetical protein
MSSLLWEQSCRQGDQVLVSLLLLLTHQTQRDLDDGLRWAAQHDHMRVIELLVDKGAKDWNSGLDGAAAGDHLHLVHFFIEKGADGWNWGLYNAAIGGHLQIVQHLIEQAGATERWPQACVSLLQQHPDVIIALFQRGKVPRECFAQHDATFEQQIVAFLDWQEQVSWHLYDVCLLPHVLCALIVAF